MSDDVRVSFRIKWGKLKMGFAPALNEIQAHTLTLIADKLAATAPRHLRGHIRRTKSQLVIEHPSAAAIEHGLKPGTFPNIGALRAWALERGKSPRAAYAIAKTIERRGIPARPYAAPAVSSVMGGFDASARRVWDDYFRGQVL